MVFKKRTIVLTINIVIIIISSSITIIIIVNIINQDKPKNLKDIGQQNSI